MANIQKSNSLKSHSFDQPNWHLQNQKFGTKKNIVNVTVLDENITNDYVWLFQPQNMSVFLIYIVKMEKRFVWNYNLSKKIDIMRICIYFGLLDLVSK